MRKSKTFRNEADLRRFVTDNLPYRHLRIEPGQGCDPGIPDICVLYPQGRVVWLELKGVKGQLQPSQSVLHTRLRASDQKLFVLRPSKDKTEICCEGERDVVWIKQEEFRDFMAKVAFS